MLLSNRIRRMYSFPFSLFSVDYADDPVIAHWVVVPPSSFCFVLSRSFSSFKISEKVETGRFFCSPLSSRSASAILLASSSSISISFFVFSVNYLAFFSSIIIWFLHCSYFVNVVCLAGPCYTDFFAQLILLLQSIH
jgi:hypothetical protein